jgi:hypothetical protein
MRRFLTSGHRHCNTQKKDAQRYYNKSTCNCAANELHYLLLIFTAIKMISTDRKQQL